MKTVTRDRLVKVIRYDPETGEFRWLQCTGYNKSYRNGMIAGNIRRGKRAYRTINIDGRGYKASKLAWLYMTGEYPKEIIDHIDLVSTNDVWRNLRKATYSQNNANRRMTGRDLPKGVSRIKRSYYVAKPFEARIKVNKKNIYLGQFSTAEEAHAVYKQAAQHHFGSFARWD